MKANIGRFPALGFAVAAMFTILNNSFSAARAQDVTFQQTPYYEGRGPECVVAADVNGDGAPDLIWANSLDNSFIVLTNNYNSSGRFFLMAQLSVGNGPAFVATADVNGDGKPDLITANSGDNTLTVLTNHGSGLGLNATLNVGTNPVCVVAADVNGDGWPDLITANHIYQKGTLTVLTNNGHGVFGSNATVQVGSYPTCVVAADVNGDGWPDLIAANQTDNTLTVLTNNGTGVFAFNTTLHVGSDLRQLIAADLNGDGKMDLVCALDGGYPTYSGGLVLFTNNGSGVLASNAMLNTGAPTVCVAAADLHRDGHVDLIAANANANTLTIFTNNGSGVFGSNATIFVATEWPTYVGAADFTGDGNVDLFTASYPKNGVTLLINTTVFVPYLNIATIGNQIKLGWQTWGTNYFLESTTNLTAPNWSAVTNPVPTGSSVTLTNSDPARLFRLHQF